MTSPSLPLLPFTDVAQPRAFDDRRLFTVLNELAARSPTILPGYLIESGLDCGGGVTRTNVWRLNGITGERLHNVIGVAQNKLTGKPDHHSILLSPQLMRHLDSTIRSVHGNATRMSHA